MVIRNPGGEVTVIDFREIAPINATRDMFGGDRNLTRAGGLAVAVPTELCGISKAYKMFHKLEWPALVDPVVDKACNGFKVSPHLARALNIVKDHPLIVNSTTFNETFYKDGRLAQAGDIITNEKLGRTLLDFRKSQLGTFYAGPRATNMINMIRETDGVMGLKDFDNICDHVKVYTGDDVLKMEFNNHTAYTPPVPSSGPVLLAILNILSGYELNSSVVESDGYAKDVDYQRMVESFKFAFGARNHLGDPAVCSVANCNATITQLQNRLLRYICMMYVRMFVLFVLFVL
jgi:gamma-glutamyltranspeptidase/glutathione hydrolase/leukotriene-C4 hydrolase